MDFQVTRLRCLVKKQLAISWLISLATFAAADPTLNSLERTRGPFEGQHILALSIPGQRVTRCARRIHEWWAWRCVLLTFRRHSLLLPLSSDRSFPDRRGLFSERGLSVLQSEFVWVWLPSIVFAILAFAIRRLFERSTGLSDRSINR